MNLENGDKLLSDIKAVISKCCNSSEILVQNEKDSSGNSFFKIYSDSILNINLEELSGQNFNICFEKCRIKFLCLSNKKIKINSNLFFESCFFEEIEISNVYFLGQFKISQFNNIEVEQIVKDIKFNNCIFNDFILEKNKFKNNIYFGQKTKIKKMHLCENEFEQYFSIQKCLIGSIDLWKNKFKNRCYFMDSIFLKIDKFGKFNFSNAHFWDNVYFNNSHFKDYVDFHECEFEKTACFYGVVFDKAPNFSACYFREPKAVNLVNANIDKLDFKSVGNYIKDNYQDENYKNEINGIEDEKEICKIENEYKLRCAKNLKDSFRVVKDVLIMQNNTLEAQEWHKLELYTKEKENHMKLSVKEREKNVDMFKNILLWFNCVLLNVYRNTSDHHNDFLKILNFAIGMIVLYGGFILIAVICIEKWSTFFSQLQLYIIVAALFFLSFIMLYFNRKKSIFAKSIFFVISGMFMFLYIATYFYKTDEYKTILYLVMYYTLGICIFYFLFNIKNVIFNISFKFLLYLALLLFLINKPQLINPFAGIFSSDKLYESKFEKRLNDLNANDIIILANVSQKNFNFWSKDQNISFAELNSAKALIIVNKENLLKLNDVHLSVVKNFLGEEYTEISNAIKQDKIISSTIKSTSVLYSIILLLCIFSLQKTARKNSIVPS